AVPADLRFALGETSPLPAGRLIELELDAGDGVLWRCALRRGRLELRGPDARLVESLLVPADARLVGPRGDEGEAHPGRIAINEAPPAWLVDANHPVRYLRLDASPSQAATVSLAQGRVTAITRT